MTVCIAAAYLEEEQDNKSGIVLCCDWKVEVGSASSETVDKLGSIKDGWPALVSDYISDADAFLDLCTERFKTETFTEHNVRNLFEQAVEARLRQKREHHTQVKHSLTFEEFRDKGSSILPVGDYSKTWEELNGFGLGATALIAGCIEDEPYIFKVHPNGTVESYDHFGAIGAGDGDAEAWLHWRGHESDASLLHTVWDVYEAKRFAEMVGSVGSKYTSLYVLKPDGKVYSVSDHGRDHVKSEYERFRSTAERTVPTDLLETEHIDL
jgi:20S proteasome alpha/beta subunit